MGEKENSTFGILVLVLVVISFCGVYIVSASHDVAITNNTSYFDVESNIESYTSETISNHRILLKLMVLTVLLFFCQFVYLKRCRKRDASKLDRMNHSMVENKIRKNALLKAIPDMIFIFSTKGHVIECKAPDMNMTGKTLSDLVTEDTDVAYEYFYQVIEQNRETTFKFSRKDHDQICFYEIRFSKYSDNEVLGLLRDISDEVLRVQSIEYHMHHDHLTGLRNRHYLREYCENSTNLGLILIDIDGLKVINDTFGLETGDALLIKVASFLSTVVLEDGFVARNAGDEFVIVFKGYDAQFIQDKAHEITFQSENLKLDNINISITLGWALQEKKSIDQTIREAENMLYKRKIYSSTSYRSKVIDTMMHTLLESNPREEAHSKRVSEYSYQLAKALNLPDKNTDEMKLAGLLHDIGKVAIQDRIVNKIGKLTEDEYIQMKMHSEKGYRILSSIDNLSEIAVFIRHHHERYDGKGYPSGLKGSEIPLNSRIIMIADSYDAMISERPYKKALTKEEAITELRNHSGTQFDATIVEVFINQVILNNVTETIYNESLS